MCECVLFLLFCCYECDDVGYAQGALNNNTFVDFIFFFFCVVEWVGSKIGFVSTTYTGFSQIRHIIGKCTKKNIIYIVVWINVYNYLSSNIYFGLSLSHVPIFPFLFSFRFSFFFFRLVLPWRCSFALINYANNKLSIKHFIFSARTPSKVVAFVYIYFTASGTLWE